MNRERIESEFPIITELIYFDIAHGNPLPSSVRDTIIELTHDIQKNGIIKDVYFEKIKEVRKKAACLINSKPSEIAFVKNTSEGLNIAAAGINFNEGDNVVLNDLEHPNNVYCWLKLREKGVEVRSVPQTDGRIDVKEFETVIDDNTKAVSVASITNLGFKFNLKDLGKLCREHDSHLVVDGIQSLGIEPLNVKKLNIDLLSSSGHKGLLSPHGIGIFYCNEEIIDDVNPVYVARTSYEYREDMDKAKLKKSAVKFEIGNYNYLGIYALSKGLDLLNEFDVNKIRKHTFSLGNKFREKLLSIGIKPLDSPIKDERSHIVPYNIPRIPTEKVTSMMNKEKVRVSGLYGRVRASFGLYNTFDEIETTMKIIEKIAREKR